VPIKEDTIATLTFQGVTGIASIDLSGGSRESPELEVAPGERYPVIQAGPSLISRLDTAVTELMENLNQAARDLHLLIGPDTSSRVDRIVGNVDALTVTLAERRQELGAGIESFAEFSRHAAAAGAELPALLERVDRALASLETLVEDVSLASRDVQTQLEAGSDSLQMLGGRTLPEVDALLVEMRQLTAGFQRLSDRLEEDPRAFLFGPRLDVPGPGE
jgi:phospholipid/cholesterol/gamma-HCH transport system substrate-binding protein